MPRETMLSDTALSDMTPPDMTLPDTVLTGMVLPTDVFPDSVPARAILPEAQVADAFPLELSHRLLPGGEAVADIEGELDMTTAETAVSYVQKLISSHHGPVSVNLSGISFCDAQGLRALLRMANFADGAGSQFRVTAPTPMLTKLMLITGLGRRFLIPRPA
jgi:anti-anti-sigma factor